jgi:phage terminase small subunit
MKNAEFAARLQELQKATVDRVVEKSGVTIERVVDELAKLAFSNLGDFFRVNDDGMPVTDFSDLTRDQMAALQQVSVEEFKEPGSKPRGRKPKGKEAEQGADDGNIVRKVTFKLYDKRAALVDLGEHLGMFKKKVELTGKDGGAIKTEGDGAQLSPTELGRRIAFALARAQRAGKPTPAPATKPTPKRK